MIDCTQVDQVQDVKPHTRGCEECLKKGDRWVDLRLCLSCGHVGCCNSSKNKHAKKRFRATAHPIVRSIEPGEDWGWCYIHEIELDFACPRRANDRRHTPVLPARPVPAAGSAPKSVPAAFSAWKPFPTGAAGTARSNCLPEIVPFRDAGSPGWLPGSLGISTPILADKIPIVWGIFSS